ncbi:hypothetical protein IGI04_036161 [Brassica rapa subsp. trilocularis]|uniref:Uncharacterized protein n=1 Tax=Brassica rapa subsp. trilocularis TaxID=1813537 RepID=A0ABQ7LDP6_BRACM|nr:hypothetical protein IGI04_036161 [Brassica rapa subsp. trilocularis]
MVIEGVLYNGRLGAYIRLRDKGSDLVPDLKRKELLDINVGLLQIRQNSSWTPIISPDWLK